MPKHPSQKTPHTSGRTIDGVGLSKSGYGKKEQRVANEAAIQAIAVALAPNKPVPLFHPCCRGGSCLGYVSIYTSNANEVYSLDHPCVTNLACWQQ